MCIIFTDKLSKVVAHYENLRDMYHIWNEHLFWHKYQLRLWRGKYSISWTRHTGRKTLTITLNDISSRNEVRASRYLTLKNNKITIEEWRTTRHKTNLENFVLRERLVDKNGWQHYVYQTDECALHGTYVRATGIELYRNDFATTTQLQVACMQWIPKTYLTFNL